ncbi:MAG: hypothetical protein E7505_07625 [Ruminococcus sp.]|jgi:hypothetical protein|nr:hypothetical protein [Ruminococcus sp.]
METKFNNANVEALLRIAAGKLNMKPEVLRKQLESGNLEATIKNMNPKDAARFQQALKNPGMVKEMMSTAQAKEMYKKITGKDPV